MLIFLPDTLYNDTCNLTNPPFFHLMFSCFQPSTRVSRRSPWHPTHHRRGRTSHHGTARHRATRSLIWVCILAASHPRKPGWAFEAKVTEQRRCSVTSLCGFLYPCLVFIHVSPHRHLFFPLQGSMSSGKPGSASLSQTAEKRPEDPRTLQQRR